MPIEMSPGAAYSWLKYAYVMSERINAESHPDDPEWVESLPGGNIRIGHNTYGYVALVRVSMNRGDLTYFVWEVTESGAPVGGFRRDGEPREPALGVGYSLEHALDEAFPDFTVS